MELDVRPLGEVHVKGKSEPVEAFGVRDPREGQAIPA